MKSGITYARGCERLQNSYRRRRKAGCRYASLTLSTRGYETNVAYSAEQAIEILAQWEPHLAIIDVMLPRMNGIDLAIALKANYPFCRSVLFSGQPATSEIVEQASKKGHLFDVLAKPVEPGFLLEAVARLLMPEGNLPPRGSLH